jgi:hypothetical protein
VQAAIEGVRDIAAARRTGKRPQETGPHSRGHVRLVAGESPG